MGDFGSFMQERGCVFTAWTGDFLGGHFRYGMMNDQDLAINNGSAAWGDPVEN
jgi:hypothetical protein